MEKTRGVKGQPEVLVIGAGPAGAIAAARLARGGRRVLVLEKQRFPRFSIGESLLAQSLELIDEAGMLEAVMAAGFQYKNGAVFTRDGRQAQINFAEKSAAGYGFTFHVPRAQFDQILAAEAARMGADVRFEVEIVAVDFSGGRPAVTARAPGGETVVYRPRFVLDASGFGRVLPRLLDLELPSNFPPRAALFTHVEDRIVSGACDRQKIRVAIHPRHHDVWYWLIPFSDGRASVGVVAPVEFHTRYSGSAGQRLTQLLAEEPELSSLLAHAVPVRPAGEIIGYAAAVKRLFGPEWALLGNAAEFLDPLFSSGVTIAMYSAKLASDLLLRALEGEAVDWDGGFARPLQFGVDTFREFIASWYAGDLQDIIFFERPSPIRRMVCSVLAGYAWDVGNPYVGPRLARRLRALAATCRQRAAVDSAPATA